MLLLFGCAPHPIDADGDGSPVPVDCADDDDDVYPDAGETCGNGVDDDCDGGAAGCGIAGNLWLEDATLRVLPADDTMISDAALLTSGDLAVLSYHRLYETRTLWRVSVTSTGVVNLGDTAGIDLSEDAVSVGGGGALAVVTGAWGTGGTVDLYTPDTWSAPYATLRSPTSLSDGSARFVADATGDGEPDLLLVDPSAHVRGQGFGTLWVTAGPFQGEVDLAARATQIHGDRNAAALGEALDAGDVDGDGITDVAYLDDWNAVLRLGPDFGATEPDATFNLHTDTTALALGDADDDGSLDLVVGCPGLTVPGAGDRIGAALVFMGPLTTNRSVDDALAQLVGPVGGRYAATTVALPGDLDGDGSGDAAMGGEFGAREAVYAFAGPFTGVVPASDAVGVVMGMETADRVQALGGVADLDADGTDELLIRGHEATTTGAGGAVWLFHGGRGF